MKILLLISSLGAPDALAPPLDTARIEQLTGAKGKLDEREGVFKVTVPRVDIDPAKSTLDPKKIDAVLGKNGDFANGVYKTTFGRDAAMNGMSVGNAMGVNTWAAFAGADDKAVVDGDFVMLESELQGVLRVLRGAGIAVVAIHQHMTGEQPRMMFLHYWGVGKTTDLARGLRAALDKTAVR